ncbi:hypothetical protein JX265_008706 [Neoarthrinium moseri]|uniref:RGS domain-containing protein n=1 Tax=Neoarthrinium moseri TaxID=1658444 RepID=A0A9P9WHA9_9PEZI|nr:hypothetical protein JX265_008706 [Neoarthrinium moseri]
MDVYSFPPQPANFDAVGKFFIAFCATWTTLVFAGIGVLCVFHYEPIIKIRCLPLSLASILMLHAYWVLAQVVYPVGMTMPLPLAYSIQYFFMGIWFPLGIALFHASNSRFLHIAKLQKQFTHPALRARAGCNGASTSWLCRFRNLSYPTRILIYIGIGMVVQVLLTVGMWLACLKYHPTFGIPGTGLSGPFQQQLVELGRGWEWWPSVLWQVIWTWIVAPILIYKSWNLRDTFGWRLQTIGCCISSLHATPMFLIASYSPAFSAINAYYPPSQWIHLSVFVFEIFTVFVPCWQVFKVRRLRQRAILSNAKWDTVSQATTLTTSTSPDWRSVSRAEKGQIDEVAEEVGSDRLLTMGALDHVLNDNPQPLQEFSALRDFSGENIAFLTCAMRWKASWPSKLDEDETRDLFTRALEIYTDFVSPRDAEFPINVSSNDLKNLESVFETPARIMCGEARSNTAVPFDTDEHPLRSVSSSEGESQPGRMELGDVSGRIQFTGHISSDFSVDVFDNAVQSIKYLVLTNTWPKYVESQRRRSAESVRTQSTAYTAISHSTLVTKVSSIIKSIL